MRWHLSLSVVSLTATASLLGIRGTGQLWPALPVTILAGAITMVILSRRYGPSSAWLVGAVLLLATHTSIGLLYPSTLSGIDPDTYAVYATQIINSGTLEVVDTRMYRALPVFLLLVSSISELTGLPASVAFMGVSLTLSVILPFTAAWFTAQIVGCRCIDQPATTAALSVSVLTMTVANGQRPIPMTLGYVLLITASVLSARHHLYRRPRDFLLLVVLGVAIMLTHKFLVLVLIGIFVVQQIASEIMARYSTERLSRTLLPLFGGGLLAIQWVYLTTFSVGAALSIATILGIQTPGTETIETVATTASHSALPREIGIVARRGHALVLLPIAGISWLLLCAIAYLRPNRRIVNVLAISAALTLFIPISVAFPSELRYTRTIPIAEPFFVALIIGAAWLVWHHLQDRSHPWARKTGSMLAIVVCLILVAQVGSAPISADHPASDRGYLTAGEASAKEWGHQYGPDNISTDPFFAHERPTPAISVDNSGLIREKRENRHHEMLEPYTTQSLSVTCPDAILYRDIRIYRSPRAQILDWDPGPVLNTEYARVFDNGDAQQFLRPKCQ